MFVDPLVSCLDVDVETAGDHGQAQEAYRDIKPSEEAAVEEMIRRAEGIRGSEPLSNIALRPAPSPVPQPERPAAAAAQPKKSAVKRPAKAKAVKTIAPFVPSIIKRKKKVSPAVSAPAAATSELVITTDEFLKLFS